MLNFFGDLYNNIVRSLPQHWRIIISVIAMILALMCIVRFIKKSNEKTPVNLGYVVLLIVFIAISILYLMP